MLVRFFVRLLVDDLSRLDPGAHAVLLGGIPTLHYFDRVQAQLWLLDCLSICLLSSLEQIHFTLHSDVIAPIDHHLIELTDQVSALSLRFNQELFLFFLFLGLLSTARIYGTDLSGLIWLRRLWLGFCQLFIFQFTLFTVDNRDLENF